jgi:hypothetical protein
MTAYEAAQVVRALSGNGHGIKAISGTCCRFETGFERHCCSAGDTLRKCPTY